MSEELVDLGHNGNEGLRVDGLVNALTGMGRLAVTRVSTPLPPPSSSFLKKSLKISIANGFLSAL
jgi:hypothetical protein